MNSVQWEKLKPVEGKSRCPVCECGSHNTLDLRNRIAVGFGGAGYSRDGEIIWQEQSEEYHECPLVSTVENMAMADPEHDWQIFFYAPLRSSVYQRQGRAHWVLVKSDQGFA